jgi:hypothetical protein
LKGGGLWLLNEKQGQSALLEWCRLLVGQIASTSVEQAWCLNTEAKGCRND